MLGAKYPTLVTPAWLTALAVSSVKATNRISAPWRALRVSLYKEAGGSHTLIKVRARPFFVGVADEHVTLCELI